MKPLPLTTRKQLPNPHRASHQVSKSTHLCTVTHADKKWHEGLHTRLGNMEQPEIEQSKGFGCCCRFVWRNKEVILTCQWLQGLRAFHFCCHNFSCHSTGCGGIVNSGFNMHCVRLCLTGLFFFFLEVWHGRGWSQENTVSYPSTWADRDPGSSWALRLNFRCKFLPEGAKLNTSLTLGG